MTCMFKAIHYCLLMYLKALETNVLKYMNLIPLIFCLHQDGLAWQACLKKTEGELELLTNNMLLMVEKGIGAEYVK